jgi:hypothetical protein
MLLVANPDVARTLSALAMWVLFTSTFMTTLEKVVRLRTDCDVCPRARITKSRGKKIANI